MFQIVSEFGERLADYYDDSPHGWDHDAAVVAHQKQANFFYPGMYSYEKGRFKIEWLTEKEEMAAAIHQDYYARHKADFIDLFKERREYMAPVIRIGTPDSHSTFALFPPYLSTYVDEVVSRSAIKEKGSIVISPTVPKSYD